METISPWIKTRANYLCMGKKGKLPDQGIGFSELNTCFTQLRLSKGPEIWMSGPVEALNDFAIDLMWIATKCLEMSIFERLHQKARSECTSQTWLHRLKRQLQD